MPNLIDVVIETPKQSLVKYKFDEKNRQFRVKKSLPAGMCFPYDFGFVPGTKGEDGDPLDVLLLSEFIGFPGCVASARIIGGMKAMQSKKDEPPFRNDRIFAIPEYSLQFANINSVNDLPSKLLEQLQYFFIHYNLLEEKQFRPEGYLSADECIGLIKNESSV